MSIISTRSVISVVVVSAVLLILSCVQVSKFDPTSFMVDTAEIDKVPASCKFSYNSAIPKVAVTNFTNNTTFDYAKMVQANVHGTKDKTSVGGAVAAAGPGVAGIAWGTKERTKFQTDSQVIQREVNAKLSESVEDGVINEIVNMGGSQVFTRSEMKKVMDEQKFQSSGLVDDNTLVGLGKLAGVKYIITGSVSNVNLNWVDLKDSKEAASKYLGLAGSILAAGASTQEGWNINTEIALRVIDVETGQVLFSKTVSGKDIIGKTPYPNYDALIGGIKKAATKAIMDVRPELSKWFFVRGYILQTRTSPDGQSRAALVNVGTKQGIKNDSQLAVYTFQEIKDPLTGAASCDKVKLPVTLDPTDQIQDDKGWFIISGDAPAMKRVKAGQIVERGSLKGQGLMQKIGY
jgi:curli biogenesis system outer membrane secretion channel CsgG